MIPVLEMGKLRHATLGKSLTGGIADIYMEAV